MMYAKVKPKLILISLDQQVGQIRYCNGQNEAEIVGVDLNPEILEILDQLDKLDVQSVLFTPLGRNAVFEWRWGGKKPILIVDRCTDLDELLQTLEKLLSVPAKDCLFVSSDRYQRGQAQTKGLHPWPHLTSALWAIEEKDFLFVQIEGLRDCFERLGECLPYRLDVGKDNCAVMLCLITRQALVKAIDMRLEVRVLPFYPALEDVLLVRLDEVKSTKEILSQCRVLNANRDTALLAVGPNELEDDLNLHGAHGHYELLTPSSTLLQPLKSFPYEAKLGVILSQWPVNELVSERIELDHLRLDLSLWSCPTSASFKNDVERYSGSADPGGDRILSRHVRHPDNTRSVNLLVADLNSMGYCAHKFAFDYGGRTFHNVIADLPGRGTIYIKPDLREKLREIWVRFPPWPPNPDPPWRKEVERLFGSNAFVAPKWKLDPERLRLRLEHIFDLRPWFPWWTRCPLAGAGAELVIVGCHLDSTAGYDAGYDPTTDTAPGADDDASGIAGSLAIARELARRTGQFRHTVRFCFFNAEEQGLIGSKAYAAYLKTYDAPIRAVICMDMIGFNSDMNHIFEIHAGYTDPAVRDLSVPIAECIANRAAALGALRSAQIYKGTVSSGGLDRNLVDGAINRSDHAAFHQQGYPAVVVSEDFFANLGTEPGADPNPNYHRATDTEMDYDYATEITCAVAHAVKELAA